MPLVTQTPVPPEYVDALKVRLGVKQPGTDDLLTTALAVAISWVNDRVYPVDQDPATRHDDVVEAIMILASRLYARRNSPEGVTGWADLGFVRIVANDPDLNALLERHVDYTIVGLA